MFSFFKKANHSNASLFPENFVDIHSHLIPGIDDGAKTFEEALKLIQKLGKMGIVNFVTTPHIMEGLYPNSSTTITQKHNELLLYLQKHNCNNVSIKVAAEYMLDANFLTLLEKKDLLTIGANHVLVEMSYFNMPINLYDILFKIQLAGYKPILAHPERYAFLHSNYSTYHKLKNAGCKFQLNLLSLTDYYGKKTKSMALKLLQDQLIDFVGSDTHNMQHVRFLNELNTKKNKKILATVFEKNSQFLK